MLHAVIMAGGSGTRFWPLSRQALPKQFLRLHGDRTLLQQAMDRITGLIRPEEILVLTNAAHVPRTMEQLPGVPASNIVGEPMGRDTAACIALAAELCLRRDPDARMAVLAADHLIETAEKFQQAVRAAEGYLDKHPDALLTFGIPPAYPSTGYGYLRRDDKVERHEGVSVHQLKSFHEKPDGPTAEKFLASGEYYWNSGIFVWNAKTIRTLMERFCPEIHAAAQKIAAAWETSKQESVFRETYESLKKISIDYAVMERAPEVAMVEAPFRWDDVGSWLALERTQPRNAEGNVVLGQHLEIDSSNCVVVAEGKQLVATIGVNDLIIVHTPDVTLVARREDEQAVKRLQEMLARRGLGEFA